MHRIQEYDRDGNFKQSFGESDLIEPYGLVVNKYGHLITIDIDESKKPHLCIFDQSGSLVHRRPLKALTDAKLVADLGVDVRRSACRFLGVHEECVYAVDLKISSVFVCDFDGGNERTGFSSINCHIVLLIESRVTLLLAHLSSRYNSS